MILSYEVLRVYHHSPGQATAVTCICANTPRCLPFSCSVVVSEVTGLLASYKLMPYSCSMHPFHPNDKSSPQSLSETRRTTTLLLQIVTLGVRIVSFLVNCCFSTSLRHSMFSKFIIKLICIPACIQVELPYPNVLFYVPLRAALYLCCLYVQGFAHTIPIRYTEVLRSI